MGANRRWASHLTKLNDPEEKLTDTDGVALPSMAVKVVDADFNDLPANEEGSLLCKGPALFVGYLKQMEQTLSEFHNGWFITGDRAIMDEDGYIRISGRDKDVIIRGGENIPVVILKIFCMSIQMLQSLKLLRCQI